MEQKVKQCVKCGEPTYYKVCRSCTEKLQKQTQQDRLDRISGVNPKCYFCRVAKNTILQIHHIDRDSKNDNKNNLMILCATCHNKLHKGIYRKLLKSTTFMGSDYVFEKEIKEVKINGITFYKK